MFTLESDSINVLFGIMDILIERGDISIDDIDDRIKEYKQFNFPQGHVIDGMHKSLNHLREKYQK